MADKPEPHTNKRKFRLGCVVITPNAFARIGADEAQKGLDRHWEGDWGEVDEHDREANEIALKERLRLLSVYRTSDGVKFYIITEADRSCTTVLLPEDY